MTRISLIVALVFLAAASPALAQAQLQVQDPRAVGRINNRGGWRVQPAAARQFVHDPFVEPMTAKKIRIAIDDAIMYLRSKQRADGAIVVNRNRRYEVGGTALAALAMLAAGADPASDPGLRKALDWLAKQNIDDTYCRGISANTWEYALRKVPYDKGLRAALKADFDWLMKAYGINKRAWRYRMNSRDWDNSCSQYGVLGIWAAQRAGFDPGEAFWKQMSNHWRGTQRPDGGWSYTTGASRPTWSPPDSPACSSSSTCTTARRRTRPRTRGRSRRARPRRCSPRSTAG